MFTKKLAAGLLAGAALLSLAGATRAAEGDTQDPFMLFKMSILDKNKDGMVSKKEFMAMVEKAYDMKVKQTGARGSLLSEDQMQALLKSLYFIGGQ